MALFATRRITFRMAVCALFAFAILCCAGTNSIAWATDADQPNDSSSSEASSSSSVPSKVEGLKKEGVLTVGLRSSSSAPLVTNWEPELAGIDVDMGATLADQMGLSVEFVTVDDVGTALANTCDVVCGVQSSEANGFDVVGNYAQNAVSLFHHGEPGVLGTDEINGKNIAVQNESLAQKTLRASGIAGKEVPTTTVNAAFDALDRGEVDFVVSTSAAGAYLSSWRDEIGFAGVLEDPSSIGMAVASGDGGVASALRGAYDRIKDNGVLSEIRRTWLGNLPELTNESKVAGIRTTAPADGQAQGDDELFKKPEAVQLEEVSLDSKDGSAAGANAVTMAEVQAMPNASLTGGQAQEQTTAADSGTGYTDYGNSGYYAETYGY